MKRLIASLLCLLLLASSAAAMETTGETIPYWSASSPAMASIMDFVASVTDEASDSYLPPEKRIAVFDSDGTLYGELFPTYFDQCLLMHRLLHDDTYEGLPEDVAYCQALEDHLLRGGEKPKSSKSSAQMCAEAFRGFTVEEYQAYIRDFMKQPAWGFENLTYEDGFYKPMTALVQYLAEHGFQVYIVSGAERLMLRELNRGILDAWITPSRVLGSVFSLTAPGQGDTAARDYTYAPEDRVILEGNMIFKNLKMNKVVSIVQEIGIPPVLAFGNSSGDLAMGEYTVQNGGKAYMLLCDDTVRDYGNLETAEKFRKQCEQLGFETVSMRDEFETIYGEDVIMTGTEALEPAA